ncbi:o-succinylbenzoate--CoA ligase [Actinomycetospora corticicola]|uniref:O-succinylbenzoic acid--CoA ligase n=1 Tax=Actinomycetospora corticicola TaxID=663602 RepID=A0A7Y9E1Q9_9PSEU|nr:o-succinylbenzoate--CoA ligase [Actinomycetospora corticicola]NYD39450.1 O-succinylbenzoic acid--CoA ligase [Actinomycetospora corticicola]
MDRTRPVEVVATDGSAAAARALGERLVAAVAGHGPAVLPTGPDDPPPPATLRAPVGPGVAAVVTTSGSTGVPKAVLLSGTALAASATSTAARLGGEGRWLLALPAHHVAGVQVLLRSARAGTPAAVMDLRDGFRPDAFAAAVRAARPAVTRLSLVPTQLRRLLDDADAGLDALRGFGAVLIGGAATETALLERARAAGVRVVTTYGMSETCGGCVYDGVPLDRVTLDLEDPDASGVGRIVLGGATVADGYQGSTDPSFLPGRRFRTSDLGRVLPGGRLEVLGRADDVIVTGGEKVPPIVVERALRAVPGVREACVVGVPDPEWGARVVAVVTGSDLEPEAVRREVDWLGRARPRAVRVLDELPLRGIGKPDRAAVRELFATEGGATPA